jgi:FMN phosphatase YigB (HAD superfamily)
MLGSFDTILLDMNGTFMFGHDRFGAGENYGATYKKLGGALPEQEASRIVQTIFDYLEPLYPDPAYRECFPSLDAALDMTAPETISDDERRHLITTFAHHELGTVSLEYAEALRELGSMFRLGLVADIWAPRERWLAEFERAGVLDLFQVFSFSSDDGIVKPSSKPFIKVLTAMNADPV